MAQIERRIIDCHSLIVHRHDAPGMESAVIRPANPDGGSDTTASAV